MPLAFQFHGRITGIATNPSEKAIRKTWFWQKGKSPENEVVVLGDEHSQILDLFNFLCFSR